MDNQTTAATSNRENSGFCEIVGKEARFQGFLDRRTRNLGLGFLAEMSRQSDGSEFVLDFSAVSRIFSAQILPLVAQVRALAARGIHCRCVLPRQSNLQRLFENTNWAHFLDPNSFQQSDVYTHKNLATQTFSDADGQHKVINDLIDVLMRTLLVDRSVLKGVEWTICEITDNVLTHADSDNGGLVQLTTFPEKKKISFQVVDTGRGILSSLRQAIPSLSSDTMAIEESVRRGVTSNSECQGNGLSGALGFSMATNGSMTVLSGAGEVLWHEGDVKRWRVKPHEFQGTIVDVQLNICEVPELIEVLTGGSAAHQSDPDDLIDRQYLSDDAVRMTIQLKKETVGFGTRQSGLQMRTKCMNLLMAEPEARLVLDWDGTQMIASSFADEFLGKLFVELGPITFMNRIHPINLLPVVRQLIDRAIVQRTQQSKESGSDPAAAANG